MAVPSLKPRKFDIAQSNLIDISIEFEKKVRGESAGPAVVAAGS